MADKQPTITPNELQEVLEICSNLSDQLDDIGDIDDVCQTDNSESDYEYIASEISDIEDELEETTAVPGEIMMSKDGCCWFSEPKPTSCTKSHNILKGSLDKVILPPGKNLEIPLDAFLLYVDSNIIGDIVKFTNLEANKWKTTDDIEISAFIGLLITAGHLKLNNTSYEMLWNHLYGPPIF